MAENAGRKVGTNHRAGTTMGHRAGSKMTQRVVPKSGNENQQIWTHVGVKIGERAVPRMDWRSDSNMGEKVGPRIAWRVDSKNSQRAGPKVRVGT